MHPYSEKVASNTRRRCFGCHSTDGVYRRRRLSRAAPVHGTNSRIAVHWPHHQRMASLAGVRHPGPWAQWTLMATVNETVYKDRCALPQCAQCAW